MPRKTGIRKPLHFTYKYAMKNDDGISGNMDGPREWSNGNCHEIIPALLGYRVRGDICVDNLVLIKDNTIFTQKLKKKLEGYNPRDIYIMLRSRKYKQELSRTIRILTFEGWSVIQYNGQEVPHTLPGHKIGNGQDFCYPIFSHYD